MTRTTPASSATLAVDEEIRARRAAGEQVLHLGFGEAGLPVAPHLARVLTQAAGLNSYGPVAGTARARAAAAGWFTRRGLPTAPEQIAYGPGSKSLLFALLAAIGGDVVLPRPAWVSYAGQAALLGRRVLSVPVPAEAGGIPDPGRLARALRRAGSEGVRPAVMVLTVPDNPTGTVAPADQLEEVCAIAGHHGLAVISDEIYSELCHDGQAPSAARYLPDRTIVTTGLSKSLALGGWRIGCARTPDSPWGRALHRDLTGVASELWSALAAPMQAVAEHAFLDEPATIRRIEASRRLHARIAAEVHEAFTAAGARCRPPKAGFYLYPDFTPAAPALQARGITTSAALAAFLLQRHGVATLPGSAFGDPDTTLTLRVATSLLYGATDDQRETALLSPAPQALPWIAQALAHLRGALHGLTAS
jgi:aspartate aminotransferase